MTDHARTPRLFALPPGVDYARELVRGFDDLTRNLAEATRARSLIIVNTSRMRRRLTEAFQAGPPRLLPRIVLLDGLDRAFGLPPPHDVPSRLETHLELAQLVRRLIEAEPDFAAQSAFFDVAGSLLRLLEEMQGEGVSLDALTGLQIEDQSGHWHRAQTFLSLLGPYLDGDNGSFGGEARQRKVIDKVINLLANQPRETPVILAGSTGSRGPTSELMAAVSRLPSGAVVLPGFDTEMPADAWTSLADRTTAEDHPQFRFATLMRRLEMTPDQVVAWTDAVAPQPHRNRLVSLALRPAPVTHAWRSEGQGLGDLRIATNELTLIETASPREEARVIALRLRHALQNGQSAALITPDRQLTRQVAAALDRWQIEADDSAGVPLNQSAPGRLLILLARLRGTRLRGEDLLVLLKHPLTHTGTTGRGQHLIWTRELELELRRNGPAFPDTASLRGWASKRDDADLVQSWVEWVGTCLAYLAASESKHLTEMVSDHRACAELLCDGPSPDRDNALWQENAGRVAKDAIRALHEAASSGGEVSTSDYGPLFAGVMAQHEVRDRDKGDPRILILGTLEARVQSADLMILGGLNDGVWPALAGADPWLNRSMRAAAGLLLPERAVGLSAHDFQQAIAGPEVWLTRARRDAEAETVPSRWVNRLTNLLSGLPDQHGPAALAAMRQRGDPWLAEAARLDAPAAALPRATRPSPRPPATARPDRLSVTQIKTLIRDPFAIYADKVLGLRPLDPLRAEADAPTRGILFHRIAERFVAGVRDGDFPSQPDTLMRVADDVLTQSCPWPLMRRLWLTQVSSFAEGFATAETQRQARASDILLEIEGRIDVAPGGITLTCKADRIDRLPGGVVEIYDYKTGTLPTGKQQEAFDKQLLLEAVMAERGAFDDLPAVSVQDARFLALKSDLKVTPAPLTSTPLDEVWAQFSALMTAWRSPSRGYTARLAHHKDRDISRYDHLARFGEWDHGDPVDPVDLT